MKASGFIRFAVNPTGDATWVIDYKTNGLDLEQYLEGNVGSDATDLIKLEEVLQKNPTIENCLLLVTFSFNGYESFNGEHTDFEDVVKVRDVIVLSTDYKEQWRKNLTHQYGMCSYEELKTNGVEEIIEWEDFYQEDYKHFEESKMYPFLLNMFGS